ncbi:MAG: hypothetical protein LBE14_01730 [Treponema sp.]|jgi:hypothetical protein|nr:hypothetical protein [Treponema sp.]
MKNRYIGVLLLLPVLFLVFACKSAPKQTEAPPPAVEETPAPAAPAAPTQAVLDALNQAVARAENARKRASDFESPSYFPSDWEAAEDQYNSAGKLARNTADEVQQAIARYNGVAGTYDDLFRKTVPLVAQALEDEIVNARNEAVATGLSDTFPDYLLEVDRIVVQALARYEGEDYYAARDSAYEARDRYQALKTGGEAYLKRQEIVERDFIAYDPENFNKADGIGLAALNDYQSGNIEQAQNGAEEAELRYNLILKTGWAAYAAERGAAAGAERQKALDLKANVAVKEEFNAASDIYNQAGASLRAEKYEDAAMLYTQSEARFIVIGQTAAEKRREAEEALRAAEQKMRESDETAKRAELILEGGTL